MNMRLAYLLAVVTLAAFTQGVVGFGAVALVVALGSQVDTIAELLSAFFPLVWAMSWFFAIRDRMFIDWPFLLRKMLPFNLIGLAIGAAIVVAGGKLPLQVPFAIFIIVLSIVELARSKRATTGKLNPWIARLMLAGGGFVQALFGAGGPLIAYVTNRGIGDKRAIRTTMACMWIALNGVILTVYAFEGNLNLASLKQTALFLPALLLGLAIGDKAHRKLPAERFRGFTYLVLIFAAVGILARSLG